MIFELLTIFFFFTTIFLSLLMNRGIRQMYIESFGYTYDDKRSLDMLECALFANLGAILVYGYHYANVEEDEIEEDDQDDIFFFPQMGNHVPLMGNHVPLIGNHVPLIGNHVPLIGNHVPLIGNHVPHNAPNIRLRQARNNIHQDDNQFAQDQIHQNDHLHQD